MPLANLANHQKSTHSNRIETQPKSVQCLQSAAKRIPCQPGKVKCIFCNLTMPKTDLERHQKNKHSQEYIQEMRRDYISEYCPRPSHLPIISNYPVQEQPNFSPPRRLDVSPLLSLVIPVEVVASDEQGRRILEKANECILPQAKMIKCNFCNLEMTKKVFERHLDPSHPVESVRQQMKKHFLCDNVIGTSQLSIVDAHEVEEEEKLTFRKVRGEVIPS